MFIQLRKQSRKPFFEIAKPPLGNFLCFVFLIALCSLGPLNAFGQDTIFLTQKNFKTVKYDSTNARVFDDLSGKIGYPEVKQSDFKPFKDNPANIRFTKLIHRYWTRSILKNTSSDTLKVYLSNKPHNDLHLYAELSTGTVIRQAAGTATSSNEWPVPSNKFVFLLQLPPGVSAQCWINTGFIYVSAEDVDVTVLSPMYYAVEYSKAAEHIDQSRWMAISFLSISFFLLLFTLFQYWQVKEPLYLYYCGYIASSFFYFLRKSEGYFFFSSPLSRVPQLIEYPETLNALLVHILYFLFVIDFLDLRKKDAFLFRFFKWMTILCVVYIAGDALVMLFTGTMEYTIVPYMQFRVLLLIPMLYSMYIIVKRHYRPLGRYVIWGSVLLLGGSSLTLIISLKPDWGQFFPIRDFFFFTYAGILLECLIFSLGLGYKGRIVLEERNELQSELVLQLEENQKIESEARARMEQELAKRTEEIHRKNKELELLKMEQTRLRIARDLHDEMGSTLSSISIMAESAKRSLSADQDQTRLDFIGEKTREVMESMSDIVWSVNPENDRFEQVVARMEELLTTLMVAQEIPFNFKIADSIEHVDIPMEKRKDFYLIFKESLNNIVKYAHARKVHVLIETPPGKIRLTVQDNGVGFDPDNISAGMGGNGLRNMRDRARMIGADLEINSSKGNGTVIRLEMPL
jgi:signal transduction histidine kinase